eukprot:6263068-Prymnesium_polylepis.1
MFSFHAATRIARGMWPARSYSFTLTPPRTALSRSERRNSRTRLRRRLLALPRPRAAARAPALHSIPGWAAASVATKA